MPGPARPPPQLQGLFNFTNFASPDPAKWTIVTSSDGNYSIDTASDGTLESYDFHLRNVSSPIDAKGAYLGMFSLSVHPQLAIRYAAPNSPYFTVDKRSDAVVKVSNVTDFGTIEFTALGLNNLAFGYDEAAEPDLIIVDGLNLDCSGTLHVTSTRLPTVGSFLDGLVADFVKVPPARYLYDVHPKYLPSYWVGYSGEVNEGIARTEGNPVPIVSDDPTLYVHPMSHPHSAC